jgi:hypothetical protein
VSRPASDPRGPRAGGKGPIPKRTLAGLLTNARVLAPVAVLAVVAEAPTANVRAGAGNPAS